MGINFQRIIILSLTNYLLRRTWRECDLFITNPYALDNITLYSCDGCGSSFTQRASVSKGPTTCPCCTSNKLEARTPKAKEEVIQQPNKQDYDNNRNKYYTINEYGELDVC